MRLEIQWTTIITTLTGSLMLWLIKRVVSWVKEGAERDKRLDERLDKLEERIDEKLDKMARATQVDMRQNLVDAFGRYFARGWVTPEERATWCDAYEAYHGLGANGLIESYRHRLDQLPDREIGA